MNSLSELCKKIYSDNLSKRPALMTHVVIGYPTLSTSIEIVEAMVDNGATCVELQFPFSDPMADGPTLMAANEQAIANRVTPQQCMKALSLLTRRVSVPLLVMSYFNILFRYNCRGIAGNGVKNFLIDAKDSGASGIIVADIPPEEQSEGFFSTAKKIDIIPIPIVSPITDKKRQQKLAEHSSAGFVYCTSRTGTTGARKSLSLGLKPYLHQVRKTFKQPVAVGFGISNREQITSLYGIADIAVVGSATVEIVKNSKPKEITKNVSRFIDRLTAE